MAEPAGVLGTSVVLATDLPPRLGELAISAATLAELHFGVLVTQIPGHQGGAPAAAGHPGAHLRAAADRRRRRAQLWSARRRRRRRGQRAPAPFSSAGSPDRRDGTCSRCNALHAQCADLRRASRTLLEIVEI